jgi:peptidyl-prolyl cis-trans isomerase D
VEEKMRAGAVKEAKANLYLGLMDGLNLEEIALEIGGSVRTAFNASTNTAAISGSGAGAEPKVVGSAFSIPVGNMSSPIEGNHGVWVIAPQSVTEAEEKTDFLDEQSALVSNTRSGVAISIGNEMREASEVVDSRN